MRQNLIYGYPLNKSSSNFSKKMSNVIFHLYSRIRDCNVIVKEAEVE